MQRGDAADPPLRFSKAPPWRPILGGRSDSRQRYDRCLLRRNPLLAVGLGIALLALSLVVPGTTRDLILRVAGVLAIVAGAVMWVGSRRR